MFLTKYLKIAAVRVPVLGPFVWRVYALLARRMYRGTLSYWEVRYRKGRTSGSGSYGRLAAFKAEVLNTFVAEHNLQSVIEFGCGDGHQLSLATYPQYIGLDISPTAIKLCQEQFADDPTKRFQLYNPDDPPPAFRAEAALSLDVIFHLIEDDIYYKYLDALFAAADRFVIIYASNHNNAHADGHVKHRRFTDDVAARFPAWTLVTHIKNAYPYNPRDPNPTSLADFYIFAPVRPASRRTLAPHASADE